MDHSFQPQGGVVAGAGVGSRRVQGVPPSNTYTYIPEFIMTKYAQVPSVIKANPSKTLLDGLYQLGTEDGSLHCS